MKTLLVIKSGYPLPLRMPAYREFFRLGWKIVVVDKVQNQSLRFADEVIIHDLDNLEELHKIILCRVGKPDGILTFNDSALVQTAILAELLELPFLNKDIAKIATNKLLQKKCFDMYNIPTAKWMEISSPNEAIEPLKEWHYMVLKPVDRSASAGVSKIGNAKEISKAFQIAVNESTIGKVIIEEYIEGPEISVETIFIRGEHKVISITDKITTEGNTFVEIGHSTPSRHSKEIIEKVKELTINACTALDLNYGAAHTEIKLSNRGPIIIEVNPRLAGDCIVDLIDLSLGINLYKFYGKTALDESISLDEITPKYQQGAAIRFQPSKKNGVLIDVKSSVAEYPAWLKEISVFQALNVPMPDIDSNAGRIAYAITTGKNGQEALENAENALSSISFTFKEEAKCVEL
ncbi:ATP-grasp domain-containing protein [Alkalihalobacterium chitinilyticum]|uniref:ATP-grasp domain-containing protein n=1 Tax=Alkalihalobacterium chitinilyticum TaxID=2980103 RepID=A0ABT5VIW8_9BACI|nr:ATP-grasp domain-containing protein [Alkalihalobacterium chitinilyticum]MDE5415405.1 ATP-grasp domain-containing protein [Alkalihalobacterium chitinilyticum]